MHLFCNLMTIIQPHQFILAQHSNHLKSDDSEVSLSCSLITFMIVYSSFNSLSPFKYSCLLFLYPFYKVRALYSTHQDFRTIQNWLLCYNYQQHILEDHLQPLVNLKPNKVKLGCQLFFQVGFRILILCNKVLWHMLNIYQLLNLEYLCLLVIHLYHET